MTLNYRKILLTGVALTALSAPLNYALAGEIEADSTDIVGADGALTAIEADANSLVNLVNDVGDTDAPDVVTIDLNDTNAALNDGGIDAGTQADSILADAAGGNMDIFVYDSSGPTSEATLTLNDNESIDVANGVIVNVTVGQANDGTASANNGTILDIVTAVNTNISGTINLITDGIDGNAIRFQAADAGNGTLVTQLNGSNDILQIGDTATAGDVTQPAAVSYVGEVTAAGGDGSGNIELLGGHGDGNGSALTGDIGSDVASLNSVRILNDDDGGDDSFAITGNIFTNSLVFDDESLIDESTLGSGSSNGTLTIQTSSTDGGEIGTITTTGDDESDLIIQTSDTSGDAYLEVTGGIGGASNVLGTITLNDDPDTNGGADTIELQLTGNSTHYFTNLRGETEDDGTLSIGSDSVTGITVNVAEGLIGGTAGIGAITITNGSTLRYGYNGAAATDVDGANGGRGEIDAASINLGNAASTLSLDATNGIDIIGNIVGAAGGGGIVDVNAANATATFEGTVGTTGNEIGQVTVANTSAAIFYDNFDADNVSANETDILLEGASATVAFDTEGGATPGEITVDGTIDAATPGQGILNIADNDTSTGGNDNRVTFEDAVGANGRLATINIGDGTSNGGEALFSSTTAATDINVLSGNAGTRTATATFTGTATATNGIAVTGEAGGAASASFGGDLVMGATGLVLNDQNGAASVTFNGTGAQQVTGDIAGANADDGIVIVNNDLGVTFTGEVGDSTNTLANINVYDASNTANSLAIFQDDVNTANTGGIVLGNGAGTNEENVARFVTSGSALNVAGDVSGDGAAQDVAIVEVTGNDQTIFSNAIGVANGLDEIRVQTGSTAVFQGNVGLETGGRGIDLEAADAVAVLGNGNNGVTVGGNIAATADGNGTLEFIGDATGNGGTDINGNIGADDFDIGTLYVGNNTTGGSDTHYVSGDVYVNNVIFGSRAGGAPASADATLYFDGNTDSGTIEMTSVTTEVADEGNLTFRASPGDDVDATISGDIGTETLGLNAILISGVTDAPADADVIVGGNIYAQTITFDENTATSSLTLNGTGERTVTAAIDGNGASEGAVIVNGGSGTGTYTFSGVVGDVAGDGIDQFQLADESIVTFNSTVDAAAIDIDGTGRLNFNDNVLGDMTFSADGRADIADGVSFTGAIGSDAGATPAGTVNFDGAASGITSLGTVSNPFLAINLNSTTAKTVEVAGNIVAARTTTLNGNTLTAGGTFTTASGDTIRTSLMTPSVIGSIEAGGNATINAGTLVDITVVTTDYVNNGAQYTIVDGTGGTGVADLTNAITDDSALLSFTQVTTNDEDLVVQAQRRAISSVTTNKRSGAVGDALDQIGDTGDADIDNLQNILESASAEEVEEIIESVSPNMDGGAIIGSINVNTQTTAVTNNRIASLRSGGTETGMTAGNIANGLKTWIEAFGQMSEQDARQGIDGYDADTYGMAIGFDTETISDKFILGVGFAYANTEVDSEDVNRTNTDIDTYQVSIYGNYTFDNDVYATGQIAYAMNENDRTRTNVGGPAINDTARAEYDADQYSAYLEIGKPMQSASRTHTMTITPALVANYVHYDPDSYQETGAGGLNLNSNGDDLDILELGLNIRADWDIQHSDGGVLRPGLEVGYRYDVIGDEVAATSSFTGAPGVNFRTEGFDPAQSKFNAGANLSYFSASNVELTASYDFEYKEDFIGHAGMLRAAYKF